MGHLPPVVRLLMTEHDARPPPPHRDGDDVVHVHNMPPKQEKRRKKDVTKRDEVVLGRERTADKN